MLDPAASVWADREGSARTGDASRRGGRHYAVRAWRANPICTHTQETGEVNNTAGG